MTNDSTLDVQKLRELASAATPGPWTTKAERQRPRAIVAAGTEQIADAAEHVHWTDQQCERNAAYIAAAHPGAVLALLDQLEQARKERDVTAEAIATWLDEYEPTLDECRRSLSIAAKEPVSIFNAQPGTDLANCTDISFDNTCLVIRQAIRDGKWKGRL